MLCLFALLPALSRAAKPGFTLWQLSTQIDATCNSYVLRTDKGRVVVLDGGMPGEAPYLRGFLAALGNRVDVWFVSHPHIDHMGALTEILRRPSGLTIGTLYQSPMGRGQLSTDPVRIKHAETYYRVLDSSGVHVVDLTEPGLTLRLDGLNLRVLGVADTTILVNAYNNSSIVLRAWDRRKSVVFLGDTGVESGKKLLAGPYRKELDCDYLQLAHHGQQGVDRHFYETVKFRAALWPTPVWVWNNDVGEGFNTAYMKTIETRQWMDELGIREHYIGWQGTAKIE